jgi:ribosomal-protein-alanine N-acetyltransferase
MTRQDLDQALCIDRESFPNPWSRQTYEMELGNPASSFFVAREHPRQTAEAAHPPCEPSGGAIGYVGTWLAGDELHISAIAVAPEFRGRGVGLQLLIYCLEYGRGEGALRATLEVRRSNVLARRLYQRLGFVVTGVRPRYYLDNGEDALVLWLADLWAPETFARLRRLRATC